MKVVKKSTQTSKENADLGSSSILTVKEAASLLGKTEQTITNWCREGKLNGIEKEFGSKTTYQIPSSEAVKMKIALDEKQRQKVDSQVSVKEKPIHHVNLIDSWILHCEQGMILDRKNKTARRPYSSATIHTFRQTVKKFLEKYGSVSFSSVKSELISIPKENFGKRYGIYSCCLAFYNFLIQEGIGTDEEYNRIKSLRPKRFLPIKKNVLTEEQLLLAISACKNPFESCLVTLLGYTGLRNTELRNLKVSDLNLGARTLDVRLGKGNKARQVGLNRACVESLERYLAHYPRVGSEYLFTRWLNGEEVQLSANSLIQTLRFIGNRKGIAMSPHTLRRSFVTINANKGRSLVALQLLCGHADLSTTRGYCMTTQDEAVAQCKGWD